VTKPEAKNFKLQTPNIISLSFLAASLLYEANETGRKKARKKGVETKHGSGV
jgi:hypothetical protein